MLEHVVAISRRGAHFLGTLGWAFATAGRTAEARTIPEELRARPPSASPVVSEAWLLRDAPGSPTKGAPDGAPCLGTRRLFSSLLVATFL